MKPYEFSKPKIVHWVERIGADIRPQIDINLDQEACNRFSKWARETYPPLFDRMVLGHQRFEMLKTLEYPGKPSVDLTTFAMTPRGPVFMVPRQISQFDLEPDLPAIDEVFVKSMKRLRVEFPGRRVLRAGKVNEYIFDCDQKPSVELVSRMFSRINVPDDGELFIRVNLRDAEYNRILTLEPVIGQRQAQPGAPVETVGFGVKITVDLNNRETKDLEEHDWKRILDAADEYNQEGMYRFLNSPGD